MVSIHSGKAHVIEAAKRYFAMGLAPAPVCGKKPLLLGWNDFAHPSCQPSEDAVAQYLDEDKICTIFSAPWVDGVALLTGWNSGGIIVLDLESAEIYTAVMEHPLVAGTALGENLSRCPRSRTPSGGAHIYIRLSFPVPAKSKPASKPAGPDKTETIIEILGQGQCAAEPVDPAGDSNGRHWEQPLVPVSELQALNREEYEMLHAILEEFDEMPVVDSRHQVAAAASGPITAFKNDPANRQRVIGGMLALGWKLSKFKPPVGVYLVAPHKTDRDVSASFGTYRRGEAWYLRNFSTSVTEFPQKAISVFDAVAILEHGGDEKVLLATLRPSKTLRKARPFTMVPLSTIKMEPVNWLHRGADGRGMFAAGLTLIGGDGKTGKSTLMRSIIAQFTRSGNDAGFLAVEDPIDSVIMPSLLAEGADPRRVMFPNEDGKTNTMRRFTVDDIVEAGEWLRQNPRVKLVVVDVLSKVLTYSGLNPDSANDARKLLDPLHEIGLELGIAVVVLHHTNKKTEGSSQSRFSGSVQIVNTARQVYMVGKDPGGDSSVRHISHVSGNLPEPYEGFSYKLVDANLDEVQERAKSFNYPIDNLEKVRGALKRVSHLEGMRLPSCDELVSSHHQITFGKPEQCAAFIAKQISESGPIDSVILKAEAEANGWNATAFNRAKVIAKERYNVESIKCADKWQMIIAEPSAPTEIIPGAAV